MTPSRNSFGLGLKPRGDCGTFAGMTISDPEAEITEFVPPATNAPQKVRLPIIQDVFGAEGMLAKHFPGYEPRRGQMLLAKAVDKCFAEGSHAFLEGPCGTGKTVAYITPAVYAVHLNPSDKVVIATANIALQEQLVYKDLPLMKEILPWDFSFALLKGVNNYVCKAAAATAATTGIQKQAFGNTEVFDQMMKLMTWMETTMTGDVSELDFVPDSGIWSRFSVTADECAKKSCAFYDSCFAMRARNKAMTSQIIVTNYHILFAHLSVLAETDHGILPRFKYLIMDEAHSAPDIARSFFGSSISKRGLEHLAKSASRLFPEIETSTKKLVSTSDILFSELSDFTKSPLYRIRLRAKNTFSVDTVLPHLNAISNHALHAWSTEADTSRKAQIKRVMSQAENAITLFKEATALEDPNKVYWIEDTDKNTYLKSKSIRAGSILEPNLYGGSIHSVIAISATMTTSGGSFDFVREEFGAQKVNVVTAVAPSPFNFAKQAMVVIPENLPNPKEEPIPFQEATAAATAALIKACEGKTLALFTSYKNLNYTHNKILSCGYRVLKHGTLPRTELVRLFKEDKNSVLLGTDSFWTGVDVPGDALTGLLVDKLPFEPPTDPVVDAIMETDKRAFWTYMIPKADIKLRQGMGRLIRTVNDVGVVVVLDNRILDSGWGGVFKDSFPEGINIYRDLRLIPGFLEWARKGLASP